MKCPIAEETLYKIAEELDMVGDLGIYNDRDDSWDMWRLRSIVSKLDDLGFIKREIAEVYFSSTYGWGFESKETHVVEYDMNSRKAAFEKARLMGFEPVDEDED